MRFIVSGCSRTELTPQQRRGIGWLIAVVIAWNAFGPGGIAATGNAPTGTPATIQLKDVNGGTAQPLVDSGQKATLLFFVMHECPVANGYAPEITRIRSEYAAKGVHSYIIYVEDDLTPEQARRHASDYGFKSGALLDPRHMLVKATGATVSPEVAVLSPKGEVLYRGRIDDRVAAPGKRRVEPTQRDLRLALDAILSGRPVKSRLTKAVGCYIPDRDPAKHDSNKP